MRIVLKTWQLLGYFGLIPFIAFLSSYQLNINIMSVNPQQAFLSYSTIILSFLSGSLWSKSQQSNHALSLVVSNLLCIFAFINLMLPVTTSLLLLPCGYLTLLLTEIMQSKKFNWYSATYRSMRIILTVIVSTLHIIAYYLWSA